MDLDHAKKYLHVSSTQIQLTTVLDAKLVIFILTLSSLTSEGANGDIDGIVEWSIIVIEDILVTGPTSSKVKVSIVGARPP